MKLFYCCVLNFQIAFSLQHHVDEIIRDAITQKVFPGASVIVGELGIVRVNRSYGAQTYEADSLPITEETFFDLASLTKVLSTTMMTMALYEDGKLRLDDRVCFYIPLFKGADKDSITIKDLLTHVSGIQPDEKIENIDLLPEEIHAHALLRHIIQLPLLCKPGTKVIYSCLNFYLLAHINELVAGETQEDFLKRRIFEPLGMNVKYRLDDKEKETCAPTTPTLQGIVHDPLAHFYGFDEGTPGNAGLFARAIDLIPFCEMILNHGNYRGKQILKKETVDLMMYCHTIGLNKRRGLGFNILDEYPFSAAHMHDDDFHTYIVGHTGYTGTMLWIDLLRKIYFVFLTNRVYPDERAPIISVRHALIKLLLPKNEEIV